MAKKYNAVARANQDVAQTFVRGAAVLTVSMVIVKVFGLLDKVVLTNIYSMFGDASRGMGLYSNAFEIFVVIFTIATGGLPIAISRLISQNMTERRYKDVKQVYRVSIPFFTIVGVVCLLVIVAASFPYAFLAIKSPYSIYAMVCLAPTVLFGCLASIYRGYFEGQRNMVPSAVSEIIEASVKLVFGAALAYGIMKLGMDSYNATGRFLFFTFADKEEAGNTILAFSVAGAICGISLGSLGSFLFLFFKYRIGGDGIPREYLEASIDARSKRETFSMIVKTALPIVGGTLVMSLGSLVDQIIIQNVIFNLGKTNMQALIDQYHGKGLFSMEVFRPHHPTREVPFTIHTALWGCYTSALTLMQLVNAVTQVFGSSAMPNVTSAWTKGDKRELKRSIDTVLKMTMMFTLPMALGLCVLSHEIMSFIYSDAAISSVGGDVLRLMGITTIFTAVITPICSMLNGIGKVRVPMILYIICMALKVATTWIFVSIPQVNIQGATVGSMIGYGVICFVGMYLLIKYSGVRPGFFGNTVKPLFGALASSVTAFGVNRLCSGHMNHRLSTILAILAAVVVYMAILLILRTFSAEEVKILPKGEKIAKTLEKLHLIG